MIKDITHYIKKKRIKKNYMLGAIVGKWETDDDVKVSIVEGIIIEKAAQWDNILTGVPIMCSHCLFSRYQPPLSVVLKRLDC